MARRVVGGVMLFGRAVIFAFGLAVVMAVVPGLATAALAATAGDPFKLGKTNTISRLTTLVGSRADSAMLKVDNNAEGPALDPEIGNTTIPTIQTEPPMKVNSAVRVPFLNADLLDGKDQSAFLSAAPYEKTTQSATIPPNTRQSVSVSCDANPNNASNPNDLFLSGGADGLADTTKLLELDRTGDDTWQVTVLTGASGDSVQAEIYCWDLPPLRP